MSKKSALGVFARAPVPGQVKTRLHSLLSEQEASDFYKLLVINTLKIASKAGVDSIQLWCSPVVEHQYFHSLKSNFDLELLQQQGNDLGEKMLHAINNMLQTHHHAILIGCDCPCLTANDIELAVNKLEDSSDVVLGPAEDGGYYLIAMSYAHAELFNGINWGGPNVLAQTMDASRKLGISVAELDEKWDVDRPEDYERFLNTVM